MHIQAVLFDLDFTLAKPGPDLGPEGYQRLGRRFGLELDPALYRDARAKAVEGNTLPPPGDGLAAVAGPGPDNRRNDRRADPDSARLSAG